MTPGRSVDGRNLLARMNLTFEQKAQVLYALLSDLYPQDGRRTRVQSKQGSLPRRS